jgi:hypothetical protein
MRPSRDRSLPATTNGRSTCSISTASASPAFSSPSDDLAEEDLLGLAIVNEERRKFSQSHPPCPACGTLNESSSFSCRNCGRNLMEKGA